MNSGPWTRDRVSLLIIKLSLGAGGSFLAAAFFLEAVNMRGFMVPAAIGVFLAVAIVCYSFARIKLQFFSLATLVWLLVLVGLGTL